MRRLKWSFLVLLLGVLSVLLPCILLVSNTSALKIQDFRRVNVQYINFATDNPTGTYTDQSITYNNSPLYTFTVPANKIFNIKNLTVRFLNSASFVKDDSWDIILYLYTFYDSYRGLDGQTLVTTAFCPDFQDTSNSIIDECNVEYHDIVDSPIDLTHLDITTPSVGTDYAVQNKIHGYYAVKLKGHFTSNGSGNAMNLYGRLITANNPTSFSLDIKTLISVSQLRIYKEIPDEDQAAEELQEMNDKDEQDRSDIESQSSTIDSSGESSQQSAQNTGTTLLAAFSSFVTAITSASPSNCNIDMDLGNLDLGIVNFCTLSPPPEFQVLGSIFLILFCVPLSIATARKVISLFRSFQG